MSAPPVHFVYFDLDDTLLDHRSAERAGLADLVAAHPEPFATAPLADLQARYHAHSRVLWPQYAEGTITREALQRLRFERTLADLGVGALDPDALNTAYLSHYARHWTLLSGAEETFHAVADRLPVGLITNGFAEIQHAKLDRFPQLRARSQAVLISEEVGYMKPHPRLFAEAAARAGVPPETILYVGDSFTSDVRGACAAGWQMAWFRPDGHTETERADAAPAFCIRTWDDLLGYLGMREA